MRGGTFYEEGEEEQHYGSPSTFYDSTGRPVALPQQQKPQHFSDDPFANFKDFADITAGADVSDFSHIVVIYANRNSTKHEPRNILEQLQLLDQESKSEEEEAPRETETSSPIKSTKLSKFKAKLRSTMLKSKDEEYAAKRKNKNVQMAHTGSNKNNKGNNKKKDSKSESGAKEEEEETSIDYVDPLVADS